MNGNQYNYITAATSATVLATIGKYYNYEQLLANSTTISSYNHQYNHWQLYWQPVQPLATIATSIAIRMQSVQPCYSQYTYWQLRQPMQPLETTATSTTIGNYINQYWLIAKATTTTIWYNNNMVYIIILLLCRHECWLCTFRVSYMKKHPHLG